MEETFLLIHAFIPRVEKIGKKRKRREKEREEEKARERREKKKV